MPPDLTPDEASLLFWFLLPQLESERAITEKIFRAVPAGREEFRPAPNARSAIELVRHIAAVELWFLDAVVERRFGKVPAPPDAVATCGEIARWYGDSFEQRKERLKKLSGEDLATRVDFMGLRNDAAVAYLNIAIRHSVHHRGQLSAYLRAMGARVPAIYVESADEPFSEDAHAVPAGKRPAAF